MLPFLTLGLATTGWACIAVGLWRKFRERPTKGLEGRTLVLVGSLLLLTCWTTWAVYRNSARGRLDNCKTMLGMSIGTALEMYRTNHGDLPDSLNLLTPTYLQFIPVCPVTGLETYSSGYQRIRLEPAGGFGYRLQCSGADHAFLVSPERAVYDSVQGLSVVR